MRESRSSMVEKTTLHKRRTEKHIAFRKERNIRFELPRSTSEQTARNSESARTLLTPIKREPTQTDFPLESNEATVTPNSSTLHECIVVQFPPHLRLPRVLPPSAPDSTLADYTPAPQLTTEQYKDTISRLEDQIEAAKWEIRSKDQRIKNLQEKVSLISSPITTPSASARDSTPNIIQSKLHARRLKRNLSSKPLDAKCRRAIRKARELRVCMRAITEDSQSRLSGPVVSDLELNVLKEVVDEVEELKELEDLINL